MRSFLSRGKDIEGRGPVDDVRRFLGRSAAALPSCLPDGDDDGGGGTAAAVARSVARSAALLPTCPRGVNDDGRRGAAADVARLVAKLQAEHIEGLVLDLRRNPGGSVQEAVDLTALFIGGGPVMQTRDANNAIDVKARRGASARYTGPLVVLTSRFSASASEIVAGALQDYGRAVVVGDPSTFGKGTVQTTTPLAGVMDQAGLSHAFDPGALKVTISKFYRPSGASTELRGVESDIVIPATSGVLPVGESQLNDPLPWDTVPATRLQAVRPAGPLRRRAARGLGTARGHRSGVRRASPGDRSSQDPLRRQLGLAERGRAPARAGRPRRRSRRRSPPRSRPGKPTSRSTRSPSRPPASRACRSGSRAWPSRRTPARPPRPPPTPTPAETASARAADALVLYEALHILADFVDLLARASHWGG